MRTWWRMTGSNRRPPACKAGALPAELIPQSFLYFFLSLFLLANDHRAMLEAGGHRVRFCTQACLRQRSAMVSVRPNGGSDRNRTYDPRLIKTVL